MSEIVKLDAAYADQLAQLHENAFDTGWSHLDFVAHVENAFDDVIGKLIGGHVAGFVVIRTQVDQSEILTIVVDQAQRGQGVGKRLLREAERAAVMRGAGIVFLEVAADNPSAQALYQNNGYHRCGTRKGYYRRQKGRVDALLFQKRL